MAHGKTFVITINEQHVYYILRVNKTWFEICNEHIGNLSKAENRAGRSLHECTDVDFKPILWEWPRPEIGEAEMIANNVWAIFVTELKFRVCWSKEDEEEQVDLGMIFST